MCDQQIIDLDYYVPEITKADVLYESGILLRNHGANQRLLDLARINIDKYSHSPKAKKQIIIRCIINKIKKNKIPGRFLDKKEGQWYVMSDRVAIRQISKILREVEWETTVKDFGCLDCFPSATEKRAEYKAFSTVNIKQSQNYFRAASYRSKKSQLMHRNTMFARNEVSLLV